MSSGATYSPGAWFALVSPSAAVLVDPELPSDRLDELWRIVQSGEGPDRALTVIAGSNPRVTPAFALAMVEQRGVRLVVRGRIKVTVQAYSGDVRQVEAQSGPGHHDEWVATRDTLWFARPGAPADGVGLPIVGAAVLADVLAWQPMSGLDGWALAASGRRSRRAIGSVADVAPVPAPEPLPVRSVDHGGYGSGEQLPAADHGPTPMPVAAEPAAPPVPAWSDPAASFDSPVDSPFDSSFDSPVEGQPGIRADGLGAAHSMPTEISASDLPPSRRRSVPAAMEPRRLSPEAIRAAAGRTKAGLGSHRRRRYGAWDWSPPEAGSGVPQARSGRREDRSRTTDRYPGTRSDLRSLEGSDSGPAYDEPLPMSGGRGAPPAPAEPAEAPSEVLRDLPAVSVSHSEPVALGSEEPALQIVEAGPVFEAGPTALGDEPRPGPAVPVARPDTSADESVSREPSEVSRSYGHLEFPDGRRIDIVGPVIVGRAPSQLTDGTDRSARLVALPQAGRGISRNHLRIDVGVSGVFVIDLGSRNGSLLEDPDGGSIRLESWVPYPLRSGTRLRFADSSCVFLEA